MSPPSLPSAVDTVVVGAGAAGCVLAARLSEDEGRDVLLLDAGPDYVDPARLPADLTDARRNSMVRHDWGLRHRPNRQRRIRFPFPRGRVVGGSSAVNTCIALRGQPGDYDDWASRGLSAWGWTDCLPFFRKLERDLDAWTDDRWHGRDGPLPVHRDPPERWATWQAGFVQATRDLGFPACDDHNAPGAMGVGAHAMNRLDGRRISAAEAWLTPRVRARPHLTIAGDSLVTRVLFDDQDRACGVEVQRHDTPHRIAANRVVLAAGAIATPGVLLRSGIGPRRVLHHHGVPIRRVLPVGERLLDHPGTAVFFVPRSGVARREDPIIQTALRYRAPGSAIPGTLQVQAGGNTAFDAPRVLLVTLMGHVGRPKGHGTLHWPTLDPLAGPQIDSRLFDHPHDRRRAVEMLQLMHALAHTRPLSDMATLLWPRPHVFASRTSLDGFARYLTDSGYHPSGTVPMGTDDDPAACTDGRGRVRGVAGLYVADASLFPTIMTANTHVPTLMVAERIAHWLRAER